MTYTETDVIASIERLSGGGATALTQEQRELLDQFHAGGVDAVDRTVAGLALTPDMTVLDVGAGFGGPARQVARNYGCNVVGIDITPSYVDAARALTRDAHLDGRVTFVCADAASMTPGDFGAAYTMHVQMNVADKRAFFGDIATTLRPGARLATFEVCRTGTADPTLPLPWSIDGSDSFLAAPGELRNDIQGAGFDLVEWVDESDWVKQWFQRAPERIAAAAGSATLPALLDDGPVRMMNYAAALFTDVVSVHRGCFVRNT